MRNALAPFGDPRFSALRRELPPGAEPRVLQVSPPDSTAGPAAPTGFAAYRGYTYDLSEYAGRKDFDAPRGQSQASDRHGRERWVQPPGC